MMGILEAMHDVEVGHEVVVWRGRSSEQISTVYKVTDKTFCVEGYGRFWKKNGKGYGDADSWHGRYARTLEHGDKARIKAEQEDAQNRNLFNEHRVRDFNRAELAAVADIIRKCNARREIEAESASLQDEEGY